MIGNDLGGTRGLLQSLFGTPLAAAGPVVPGQRFHGPCFASIIATDNPTIPPPMATIFGIQNPPLSVKQH